MTATFTVPDAGLYSMPTSILSAPTSAPINFSGPDFPAKYELAPPAVSYSPPVGQTYSATQSVSYATPQGYAAPQPVSYAPSPTYAAPQGYAAPPPTYPGYAIPNTGAMYPGQVPIYGAPQQVAYTGVPPGYVVAKPPKDGVGKPGCEDCTTKWTKCTPLIVYIVFVIIWMIATIFAPNNGSSKVFTIVSGLLWSLLWGSLILMLCRRGHRGWAWLLALWALVIWAIVLVLIFIGWLVFF